MFYSERGNLEKIIAYAILQMLITKSRGDKNSLLIKELVKIWYFQEFYIL